MNGLTLYVRTRTQVLDYRFIGKQQPERWWEETYGSWTDFSRPTVIVESDRFFIAGIPSAMRTDSKGAGIHYAIVAEIESEQARMWASAAARQFCEQVGCQNGWRNVGKKLDVVNEETWVAAAKGDDLAAQGIVAAVIELLTAASPDRQYPRVTASWSSGQGEENFRRLGETAAAIVQHAHGSGLAAFLNLASADDKDSIFRRRHPVALVYPGEDPSPKAVAPVPGAKLPRS
jgi:hypothetical protein